MFIRPYYIHIRHELHLPVGPSVQEISLRTKDLSLISPITSFFSVSLVRGYKTTGDKAPSAQNKQCKFKLILSVVAQGQAITSSRQITEVKQLLALLVLGWVTSTQVTLPAMCSGVGQASHVMPPLSAQQ